MGRSGRLFGLVGGLVLASACVGAADAAARGGGGGGGGGGTCTPLTTVVTVGQSDFSLNWRIGVQATVRNCTAANQLFHLNVVVPNSGDRPFDADLGLAPGASVTRNASPSGSTPLQLRFGRSYNVVTTLSRTTSSPATVLATSSSTVTIPAA